jgi:hypothetical protein
VRIKPSQVVSLSAGEAARRRVAEVDGAQIPVKPPSLFGLLQTDDFFGLVYEADGGKRAAMLLDSLFSGTILRLLSKVTGKPIENSP